MSQSTFSFSRFQKLSFCKRAFYFHYQSNEDDFDLSLFNEVQYINQTQNKYLAVYQLKRAILRSYFYQRNLSQHRLKQKLAQEGNFHTFELHEVDAIFASTLSFKESQFFIETESCFTKHLETDDIPSFQLEGTKVLGNIDFAWYDKSGVNLVCLCSKQKQQPKINFMHCYALRELKASPHKINIGILNQNNDHWHCEWQSIDWPAYQDYLDQILSYSPPSSLTEATAVSSQNYCNTCEYLDICQKYSDILDT